MSAPKGLSRKRRCTYFAVGDFVHGLPGDREGVVVRRQGKNTVVVGCANIVATYPSTKLKQSTWRDTVGEGDVVEFLSGSVWHPAVVRGVQTQTESVVFAHSHCGKVLVVEPAFLGFTLSFPLRSLRVRQLSKHDTHTCGLLDSGFAFDKNLDRDALPWPEYHPNGCLYTRDPAPKYMALSDYDKYNPDTTTHVPGTSQRCWVVEAPCRVPDDVSMIVVDKVRLPHTLFVHRRDLFTTAETRLKKPLVPVTRVKLGTRTVSLKDILPLNVETSLLAAEVHVRNGDSLFAARKLFYENMHSFVSNSERETELLKSLLFYASSMDHGVHLYKCTIPVWGHNFRTTTSSAAALRQSLSQVLLATDRDVEGVVELHQRACIWSNYEREWRHARWLQRCSENTLPLEISVSDMSVANRSVTFDVTLVLGRATSDSYPYTEHWLRHGATVLSSFSSVPPNLGCFDPNHWHDEMLRVCGHEGAKKLAETAFLRVSRASWGKPPLSSFLERSLTTADGHRVSWNVCEGACTHAEETLQFSQSTLNRPRGGGVLVLPCDFDAHVAVKCMVDMHQRGTRPWPPPPVSMFPPRDRQPPCLVLTSPTKLFDWQRMFAEEGLDSHVYHGCGRRGPAATEALARGGVLIATHRVMCEFYDMFYFSSVLPEGFSHVFVDEFDISNPAASFVDGLMQVYTANIWMLATRATRDVIAFALPLLRVEPFYSRSQWHTDGLTHYRFRTHAQAFVSEAGSSCSTFEVKRTLHNVLSRVVFCLRDTTPRPCVVHTHHRVGGVFSMQHRLLFKVCVQQMMQRRKVLKIEWNESIFQMQNAWQHLLNAAWGVRPPVHMCGERTPWNHYEVSVNADAHAEDMLRDAGDSQMVRDAALMVTSAAAGMKIQADCPICFEPLSKRKFGLVGHCGHSVCCQCIASMKRAAVARAASSVLDVEPEISCPMCRQKWWGSTVYNRPLLLPCDVDARAGVDTRPAKNPPCVYLLPRVLRTKGWVHKNPMLCTLERLVARLRAHRAKVFGDSPKCGRGKIVVVTQSNDLCNHLWSHFEDFDTPTTLCSRINGCVSVKNRGCYLISFQSREGNFDLLFITTKMLRGLVFEHTEHWIVCEKLSGEHAEILERSVRATARAAQASGVRKQTVHTLDLPESRRLMHLVERKQQWLDKIFAHPWKEADVWKTWSAMGPKCAATQSNVQTTTRFPCAADRLRRLVARPESEEEYILQFRRFLGIHTALGEPNELERSVARELAEKDARAAAASTIDLTEDTVVTITTVSV